MTGADAPFPHIIRADQLLSRADALAPFEVFHFHGHWDTDGQQLAQAIRRVAGQPDLPLRRMPWWALRLAALHVMTSLTGSALLALAVDLGELDAETAWNAAHVDDDFQAGQWGQDAEALARRANRRRDMMAATALLEAIAG